MLGMCVVCAWYSTHSTHCRARARVGSGKPDRASVAASTRKEGARESLM